ncbi:cupin domain-containing protein [Paraflavitalea speifideaquila]|uniref:cupin domain-containing protein n=1 Tax=Paraflavitalea speifideaquila TaxID=3076558 RepID=UPI0028EE59A0|nr:cupin domain-containing protein [Paraflavitalea speifideiaquila]
MKVVQFTIPVATEYSIIVQEDVLPYFYNHLHRHNEIQITWVMKGEGTLIAGNSMQRFKPGDIFIIGANQPHLFKSDPAYFEKRNKKEIHALTMFVDPGGLFSNILHLPEMKGVKKFLEATAAGMQIPQAYKPQVMDKMLQVKEARNGIRLAMFIQLLQLMTTIKNTVRSPMPGPNTRSVNQRDCV